MERIDIDQAQLWIMRYGKGSWFERMSWAAYEYELQEMYGVSRNVTPAKSKT